MDADQDQDQPDGTGAPGASGAAHLYWWARKMVESIITYSLSASRAKASKTRAHTPVLLLREWQMQHPKVPEALGQIAPWNASSVSVQHCLHKHSVVSCRYPNVAFASLGSKPFEGRVGERCPPKLEDVSPACRRG